MPFLAWKFKWDNCDDFHTLWILLADLLAEAIKGICIAEQKGLLKILDNWKEMQPVMEGLQQKQHTKKWIYRVSLYALMGVAHASSAKNITHANL